MISSGDVLSDRADQNRGFPADRRARRRLPVRSFLFSLAAATGITATTLRAATTLTTTTTTTTTTIATPANSPTAFGNPAPFIIYHFNTFDDDGLRKCRRCCGYRANGHRAKECTLRQVSHGLSPLLRKYSDMSVDCFWCTTTWHCFRGTAYTFSWYGLYSVNS
jgi:hypothetical protein